MIFRTWRIGDTPGISEKYDAVVTSSPRKSSSKRRARSECWRGAREEGLIQFALALIPALFPSYFIGTRIGHETEERSDDEEKYIFEHTTVVVWEHKDNCTNHIVYAVPWLKHRSWFDAELTLKKTLHDISKKRSETEPSTEKGCTEPARIEIKIITIHWQNTDEHAAEYIEQKSCEHATEDARDESSDSFIFAKEFCMNRTRKMTNIGDIFCDDRHCICDESRSEDEKYLEEISEEHSAG